MRSQHLVVGLGEVGLAVFTHLHEAGYDVWGRDIDPPEDEIPTIDVMHICIPYTDEFVQTVTEYQETYLATLVVVHSTVPVGTCAPHEWTHSPIRGKHPELKQGVDTFVKHYGGPDARIVADLCYNAWPTFQVHTLASTTEAGKLWELVQYGWQIIVEKSIHTWCLNNGLPFDQVYTGFARTYNNGWADLEQEEYMRPIIEHVPGPIGGHCVIRGAELLESELSEALVLMNDKLKDGVGK